MLFSKTPQEDTCIPFTSEPMKTGQNCSFIKKSVFFSKTDSFNMSFQ